MKEIEELKELFGGLPWGYLTTEIKKKNPPQLVLTPLS